MSDILPGLLQLADDLAAGRTSARALAEAALAKIHDPDGEGVTTFIAVDDEAVLANADHLDALRKRGRAPSAFAGIPFSVKDLFDQAGEVTRAGSRVLADAPPAAVDAPAVARLKAMGLVVLGRTNMTEFAYSGVGLNPHYGTPRSVYDRKTGRIPGGSSSGAGVSVGDGMCALAIGTDTGGSCRIPAAFNGIVGLKSSVGRVPTKGAFPLSRSLDAVGPLAVSVSSCAIADAIMAGDWDGRIAAREAATLRFGIPRHVVLDNLDAEVAAAFEATRRMLEKAGAGFVDVDLPAFADLPAVNAGGGITAVEASHVHHDLLASHGDQYDQRVRRRIQSGEKIPAPAYLGMLRFRERLIVEFKRQMQGLDALVMPTTPNIPPPITALERDEDYGAINFLSLRNTFIGNFLDSCALSLPMTPRGEAPAGLMLMAPWGSDQALFAMAQAVEGVIAG
jgi:aspartyl-tRNA(Asn)/glutamyl-tRNA(Gln) amidotransferase subunit A